VSSCGRGELGTGTSSLSKGGCRAPRVRICPSCRRGRRRHCRGGLCERGRGCGGQGAAVALGGAAGRYHSRRGDGGVRRYHRAGRGRQWRLRRARGGPPARRGRCCAVGRGFVVGGGQRAGGVVGRADGAVRAAGSRRPRPSGAGAVRDVRCASVAAAGALAVTVLVCGADTGRAVALGFRGRRRYAAGSSGAGSGTGAGAEVCGAGPGAGGDAGLSRAGGRAGCVVVLRARSGRPVGPRMTCVWPVISLPVCFRGRSVRMVADRLIPFARRPAERAVWRVLSFAVADRIEAVMMRKHGVDGRVPTGLRKVSHSHDPCQY
jgi:hypothetical protein